ncbi:hypothetical protein A3E89_01820 [Candidatus Campbellbacteria bacterium RIFCSPHIGHO2_12_FULL_35_10]|uniref:Uncharacterized protein n=1 Tax=Candidatus Campbellbacteria bacterium RIFCSPHIGHO2_12_FULL_35_10 TaxID=1797578 RepID=A0A1F5EMS9_9BACT|nr:MAG: hypothetical protein A3E89_01820 [Candidatus Campbellbacteria bacterium RIFCSPHIGHO2_12_FULL_35_10]
MSPTVSKLISNMNQYIIFPIIDFLLVLAVLFFVWGLAEFIYNLSSGGDKDNKGKQHMLWGIIGLFIMVTARPIIKLVLNSFGIDTTPIDNAFILN